MKTTSLEILEKSELPTLQTHAILKVMELEIASSMDPLAAKLDLLPVRQELMAVKNDLEAKLQMFRADLEAKILSVRAELLVEIRSSEGRLTRWVFTCILGQSAVLAGLGYFVVTHFAK